MNSHTKGMQRSTMAVYSTDCPEAVCAGEGDVFSKGGWS